MCDGQQVTSCEDRGHTALAGGPERIAVREPLVELGIRSIPSLQQYPFDVDELAVLPHPDPDLAVEIQLVL